MNYAQQCMLICRSLVLSILQLFCARVRYLCRKKKEADSWRTDKMAVSA